jgi:DICT domain-containing protein
MSDVNGKVPLQISADFLSTYNAQTHEIVDAIAAAVTNAHAGLNWLRTPPLDLEEARRALNSIAKDSKRAGQIIARLRALMNTVPTADGDRSLS